MEKNTTNYKFLNAKDCASERKNSHGILDMKLCGHSILLLYRIRL